MEELLERIAKCVELGKINEKTPYPPAMKGYHLSRIWEFR